MTVTRKDSYDDKYQIANFFRDKAWVYRPYVRALVRKSDLAPKERLLDAGCGQGFFAGLFGELGFRVVGVDTSAVGIGTAVATHGSDRVTFECADVLDLPYAGMFDAV